MIRSGFSAITSCEVLTPLDISVGHCPTDEQSSLSRGGGADGAEAGEFGGLTEKRRPSPGWRTPPLWPADVVEGFGPGRLDVLYAPVEVRFLELWLAEHSADACRRIDIRRAEFISSGLSTSLRRRPLFKMRRSRTGSSERRERRKCNIEGSAGWIGRHLYWASASCDCR